MSFVDNVWLALALWFLNGISQGGIIPTANVMASELVGPKFRGFASASVCFSFTIGLMLVTLQAYYVQEWRTLLIITSIPYAVLLPTYL